MSQQQQEVIAYLREENKILREKLGRRRILLSIEQKRRLATKGKVIGQWRGPRLSRGGGKCRSVRESVGI